MANGKYPAGKEVCIVDVVHDVLSEPDYHIRMATFPTVAINPSSCPFPVNPPGLGLVTELTPEYQAAGISLPSKGQQFTCKERFAGMGRIAGGRSTL